VIIGASETPVGNVTYVLDESFNIVMIVMIAILAFVIVISVFFGCMALFHTKFETCCPGYYGDGHGGEQFKSPSASSGGPPYETFDAEDTGDSSSGSSRRKGKAGRYEMSIDGGDAGASKYHPKSDGDIEMVGIGKKTHYDFGNKM
jgi:hypothetical protein